MPDVGNAAGEADDVPRRPYMQPSRIGRHRIQRWIGPRCKRQVKLICINNGITESDFFGMALNMAFAHFRSPTIAFESDLPFETLEQEDRS